VKHKKNIASVVGGSYFYNWSYGRAENNMYIVGFEINHFYNMRGVKKTCLPNISLHSSAALGPK
jgi:hypothetical protein